MKTKIKLNADKFLYYLKLLKLVNFRNNQNYVLNKRIKKKSYSICLQ